MVGTRSTRNKDKDLIREPLRERTLSYDDPNALGEAGENQAARQESGKLSVGAKDIARYLEITRSINWSENTGPKNAGAGKQRTASVLQRRGDVSQPACSRCEQGNRVFGSCVSAPVISGHAFQRGACANCIWDGKEKSCSLRGDNLPLDSVSIRQFTGDGYHLRHAIREEAWIDCDPSQSEPPVPPVPPVPPEMKMYVDAAGGINASSEVNAPSEDSSGKENDGKPSSEKGNVDVAAFLTEIKPHHSLSRVGTSQHGPRCHFDGVELKFPISREVWESERRLLKARSDLAHFVAIIDTRLYDMGYARSDAVFWEREARRMTRLFTTGRRNKKGKPAPGRRPSLTPPPKIVISDASTPSPLLPASDPTPQIEPPQHTSEPIQAPTGSSQRTGETAQARAESSQRLLPHTNTKARRLSHPPTIATSSRDRRVWDRPRSPDYSDNDKENPDHDKDKKKDKEVRAPGLIDVPEDFDDLHESIVRFDVVMEKASRKAPTEEPAPAGVDPDEEERESCKESPDPSPAPAPAEPVRGKYADYEERGAPGFRRPRPREWDEGSPPIVSKRHRSERHGDRARE